MSPIKDFMSLEETAELLGVNYQLIYKLVRTGELPAARIGKMYRILRKDLEHYLEQSKSASTAGTCAACGTAYQSKLSLKYACPTCGEPICIDCWDRRHVRHCTEHTPAPAETKRIAKDRKK